ncbi:transmembrane protein 70, mitochondrial [Anomaloglossus baeobatrachus]|uniref:transmembrane protein 70, mitochondrial n=1 Tax=Anomaloglossus baeobatrachus TaxID=238106 RepID=UPI003F50CA25
MLWVTVCRGHSPVLRLLGRTVYRGSSTAQICLPSLCSGAGRQVSIPDVKIIRFITTSSTPVTHEQDRLVYTGNLGRAVLGVKFFSYSTSMITLLTLPMVFAKSGIGIDGLALQIAFFSVIGFFTFVTPVTLHFVTKGYVVRLYHNKERDLYTAITYSALLVEKKTEFSPEDVDVPGMSKMFTTFYAKKKSMLVNPMLFPNASDYQHLMGYDKPFTFHPEDINPPSKEK